MPLLVTLLAGQAMASMDGEILVVAAPSLREDLHTSGAQLQLIVAMYTLAFGALVVSGARLGDVLGRGRVFLLGLTTFTLASLAGGLAPTASVLIGAVGAQGVAAALMTPQVLSIIQLHFAGEERARAIGAYSMVLAAGVATGMVLGGLLVTAHLLADAWRPALLLNVPVGALVLLSAWRHLPEAPARAQVRLDPAGAATLTASLVGQVLGIVAFVGVYLSAARQGSAHAFALTTGALSAALTGLAGCAFFARLSLSHGEAHRPPELAMQLDQARRAR